MEHVGRESADRERATEDRGTQASGGAKKGSSIVKGSMLSMKDLMNIGIFTAVNMVVGIAVAVPVGLFPIGLLAMSAIGPIVSGIIVMLFITKIKKPGMLFIMFFINGLVLLFTGMGAYALLIGCVTALAAELILRAGRYESVKLSVVAYATASIAVVGNYVQWAVSGQDYVEKVAAGYGREFAQTVAGYFADPTIYAVLVAVCFVSGLVGGVLGHAVFKKHFERAGIV